MLEYIRIIHAYRQPQRLHLLGRSGAEYGRYIAGSFLIAQDAPDKARLFNAKQLLSVGHRLATSRPGLLATYATARTKESVLIGFERRIELIELSFYAPR